MNGVGWLEEVELAWAKFRKVRQENDDMRQLLQAAVIHLSEYADVRDMLTGDAVQIRRIVDQIAKFGGNNG
jgi:hypothetical protein